MTALYERTSPSVVFIRSLIGASSDRSQPGGRPRGCDARAAGPGLGTGSGFVLDQLGNILTNNHVVRDSRRLEVVLFDGTSYSAAIIGRDPQSDLAIIKVDAPAERLQAALLGDSDQLKVGQLALAVGNPYGYSRTLTVGVVSGLARPIPSAGRRLMVDMIQTDAALNPGNSGGPLLSSRGEVIGINTAVDRDQPGVGFAVPINRARRFMPDMLAGKTVRHPWLGLSGLDVTTFVAAELGLPVQSGVLVANVLPNGPAAQDGLRGGGASGGDIVQAIDGKAVATIAELIAYADRRLIGDRVTLRVLRVGQALDIAVVLGEFPDDA